VAAFSVAAVVITIVSVTVAVSVAVGMVALLLAGLFFALIDLRHRLDVRHRQTTRTLRSLETFMRKDAAARDKAAPDQLRQVEAVVQMYTALGGQSLTPLSGRWAMDPIGLMALVHHVDQHRPGLVLELGGGTSTVWLQRALSRHAGGRLVSVDHDGRFLDATRTWLADEPGSGLAQVRHAPLEAMEVSGRLTSWYQPGSFDDLVGIDMLIVDGPPQSVGPWARFPALPLLVDRLADEAWIVLDDAERPDERRIVEAWLEEIPGLSVVSADGGLGGRHTFLRFERREV
jgi:predicted O-methyltransferase YrrM